MTAAIDTLKEIRDRQRDLEQKARAAVEAIARPRDIKPDRFKLTWFDEVDSEAKKETFVKGVFAENEFTTVVGQPGAGKSVIVTDIACHVAAGLEWHGRRVRQGMVVYIAAERKELTERRLVAFRKRHDVSNVPLLVLGGRIDFTGERSPDAEDIAAVVKAAEEAKGQKCIWLIVDTLTRVFGGGDQNTSKDMGRFIGSCDRIRDLVGAHVTVIHHSGHAEKRGKGAIDLDGAVDASFYVERNSAGQYSLVCDGANDGLEGPVTTFLLESLEIGTDEDGEPVTAPVVVQAGEGPATQLVASIRGQTAKALDILKSTSLQKGICGPVDQFPPDALIVSEDQWRQDFYDAIGPHVAQKTLIARFSRAKSTLLAYKSIQQIGQWVWIPQVYKST